MLPGKFSLGCCQLELSAANLHLLLLADQRVEHEDEGEEVEVDGEADLQEHGFSRRQRCSTAGSESCLNCVSCVGETPRSPSQLSGDIGPGLFFLIRENQMD